MVVYYLVEHGMTYVYVYGMTIKQTLHTIKTECPSLTARYNSEYREYRITTKSGTIDEREAHACYTNDSQDAIDTARHMHSLIIKG